MKTANITQQNVSSLFASVGIKHPVIINTTEHTYEVNAVKPKNNWLYPAFKGFLKLRKKLPCGKSSTLTFASIGTGQGIDAIGAYHIFHPKKIIITDIHPEVIPIAKNNFLKNTDHKTNFVAYVGNLCDPLSKNKIVADIIYANLPNIPFEGVGSNFGGQLTSTFFNEQWINNKSRILEKYLLSLQNAFLYSAWPNLSPRGSVIVNLGGRIPLQLIKKMFTDAGFKYEELFNTLKIQSQPEWVLGGYARAEEKYKVTFDFYRFDAAKSKYGKKLEKENLSANKLKKMLRPFRISATEGLKLLIYRQETIGHLVQIIRGVKK